MNEAAIKYVLKPGYITRFGKEQFISSSELIMHYGVDPKECVIVQWKMEDTYPVDLERLTPKAHGCYARKD